MKTQVATLGAGFLGLTLAGLTLLGCDVAPVESAPAGATPAVAIPVGPLPGPGAHPPLPKNPYAENQMALMQGRKLFTWYNCAGCHGGHGGGGMGPSLRDESWIYGNSDAHIFDSIAAGRAHGMPAWGTKLPIDHIWKLTAYVQSLGSPREPKPPVVASPKVRFPPETRAGEAAVTPEGEE